MHRLRCCHAAAALIAATWLVQPLASQPAPPSRETRLPAPLVRWNDNDRPAGSLREGRLRIDLEIVPAEWRYLGQAQPGVPVLAFREVGRAPENPGPLIRVVEGTQVDVTVRNGATETLVVHGLTARRGERLDSLVVPAGETREAHFLADAAGTWYYWAAPPGRRLEERLYQDSQLTGALLIDPRGTPPGRERVMIMSIYFAAADSLGEPEFAGETFAINGRPWPHTERLTYDIGDTVRWRIINTTDRPHPMHLHGFYFGVDGRGDNEVELLYGPRQRGLAVTELMRAGETRRLSWVPDRPGGWIFHCHIGWHVVQNAAPGEFANGEARDRSLFHPAHHGDMNAHVVHGMGGLLMAIEVRMPLGWRGIPEPLNRIRLFVQSDSAPADARRRFGYVLAGGQADPPLDSVSWPGPTLIAHVGEPTAVTVINRTPEWTQVHWHGLELESFYDGAPGVSGYPGSRSPAIAPGDSFTMRITPPRAGSYMYHTHVHDARQQSAGLYGAFLVLPTGEQHDPKRDLVFLSSSGLRFEPLLNGSAAPPPLTVRTGEPLRIRAMNITFQNGLLRYRLTTADGDPVLWEQVAKDGAELPPQQRRSSHADQVVSVGETYDFLFTPDSPGPLRLEIRAFTGRLFASQILDVRPD